MTPDTTTDQAVVTWQDDARALILNPKQPWNDERPLASEIARVLLSSGASVSQQVRDQVLVAALAFGDDSSPAPAAKVDGANREGVRGYLWLPGSFDDDLHQGGLPTTEDDVTFVADGKVFREHEIKQRQRWAGLRMGRALGVTYSPGTARQYGYEKRSAFADRLVEDVEAFFASDEAVEDFAVSALPRRLVQERFSASRRPSHSLHSRLTRIAESLGRLPVPYPDHLGVQDLVARRVVARLYHEADGPTTDEVTFYARHGVKVGPSSPALATLASERRAVLLGDPGSGKSTLARSLVIEASTSPYGVAVFVSAPLLARSLARSPEPWLTALARIALSLRVDPPNTADVDELARLLQTEDHTLVVLDGLDEVFAPEERQIVEDVVEQLDLLPGSVLITSRLMGYRRRRGWSEYVALPLEGEFQDLLERWYPGSEEVIERAATTVAESSGIRGLVENPVLAGIMAALAPEPLFTSGLSRPLLYRRAVTLLSERSWRSPHHPHRDTGDVHAMLTAYEETAWRMIGRSSVVTYAAVADAGLPADLLANGELLTAYGLNDGSPIDQTWIWLHRSFAEYFVGMRLLRDWHMDRPGSLRILRSAIQYVDVWGQPLRFLVESLDAAEQAELRAVWNEMIAEGDPGGVVAKNAHYAFGGYGLPPGDREFDTYVFKDPRDRFGQPDALGGEVAGYAGFDAVLDRLDGYGRGGPVSETEDLVKALNVLSTFRKEGASDPAAVLELADALAAVPDEAPEPLLQAIVRLSDLVGGYIDSHRRPSAPTTPEDLEYLTRRLVAATIDRLDAEKLLCTAYGLYLAGEQISARAVPELKSLHEPSETSREFTIDVFDWMATSAPRVLDLYDLRLVIEDESFYNALMTRLGSRLIAAHGFYLGMVSGLEYNGKLAAWRDKLIAFERAASKDEGRSTTEVDARESGDKHQV